MQRLFSLLVTIAILSLVFAGYFREITAITQDLGRHILTGNIIFATHEVPKVNLFSYTYPTYEFINHHWFSEVIFALIFNSSGYEGLIGLTLLLSISAFGFLLLFLYKKVPPAILLFSALLYLPILFERTDIRPELFSFLFLSLFIVILYRYRERFTSYIFLLPFIELLWTNSHIYFPIGIGVTGLFFIEELFTKRQNLKQKHTVALFLVLLLSILITTVNPDGITGALYPFTVFNNYGYTIEENQTSFFLSSLGIYKLSFTYLLVSIALLFVALSISIKKTRLIDWLLSVTFSIIALMAVRNFPLFVFATFIPFTLSFSYLYKTLFAKRTFPPIVPLLGALLLFLFFFFSLKTTIKTERTGFVVPQGATKAVDFFVTNNLKGPLFNNFDIGSYLEYRLYPQEKVFIDGRPEAYPASFIKNVYIPMQENLTVFHQQEKKYQFNTIIFSHTDMTPWAQTFLQQIATDTSWKPVYLDPTMVILVKENAQNDSFITQFSKPYSTLPIQNMNENNLNEILRVSQFFAVIAETAREQSLLQKALALDPNNCYALSRILTIQTQNPLTPMYNQRFESSCL